MSEQQSGRDEKGLTISGRTMLRLMMKFGKTLLDAQKLGSKAGFELLQTPTVLLEVRALIWIASQMAKRIGSREELSSYLKQHEEADEKSILDGMAEVDKALLDEVIAHGGLKKCTSCDGMVCPICQECHACNKGTTHETSNPFGFPGGGAPN